MTVLSLVLFTVLLIASFTDIRSRRLPNWLTYGGLGLGLLLAFHADYTAFSESLKVTIATNTLHVQQPNGAAEWFGVPKWITDAGSNTVETATGTFVLTIPLLLLYVSGGVGGGDVKLGACIGAFTGVEAGISILFLGHLLAGVFALTFIIGRKELAVESKGIPMAVFYSLGTLLITTGVWR